MKIIVNLQKQKQGISKVATLLLLIVYLTGTISVELLHSIVHNHEVGPHGYEQTKNDGDGLKSEHDNVAHEVSVASYNKCYLCDIAFYDDQNLSPATSVSPESFRCRQQKRFYKSHRYSYSIVILSSRAPPTLMSCAH